MATKYTVHFFDGTPSETRAKKDAAIKIADAADKPYQIVTDAGTVVVDKYTDADVIEHAVKQAAPTEEAKDEVLYYETLDFPGNYSIVLAPFAVEVATAAGVPAKQENTPGLLRHVRFGGTDMDLTSRTVSLIQEEVAKAREALTEWQHKHAERRRGLTDMQRYVEHREFLADWGHKVAKRVRKDGV